MTSGARIGLWLHHAIDGTYALLRDGVSALFLGLSSEEDLDRACRLEYDARREFRDAEYGRSGLYPWERDFADRYLRPGMRVLVSSAGGGREVLALSRLGFAVSAFECNPGLVACGDSFLNAEGVAVAIVQASAGECPEGLPACDAIVVGWGSYHHIRPSDRRIRFLRSLRRHVNTGGPILVSFFEQAGPRALRPSRWANRIRRLLRRPALDRGDVFGPPPMHLFTREEIDAELRNAGFRLDLYRSEGYPHAVGIAVA